MTTLVRAIAVTATPPSLRDNSADIERLQKAVRAQLGGHSPVVPLAQVTTLSKRFRQAKFSGAAIVNDLGTHFELVDFMAEMPTFLAAIALDLGTTHLEASLVDLLTGQVVATVTTPNAQLEFGDDILTRIHFAGQGEGLALLHQAVLGSINQLARQLAEAARIEPAEIRALSVAGNPTMVHLFLGLDPYHLCREPYIPMINAPGPCRAGEIGLAINHFAPVFVVPGVGSYFGGDLLAGILASGLDRRDEICLLIDVGTNAEVVLGNKEWLIACAGAAGPALEGGVARMGMRAGPGAIEHLSIEPGTGELRYTTIAGQPAKGICGSGLIDLVAALYLAQLIDLRGKFRRGRGEARLAEDDAGLYYTVVPAAEAADGRAVILTQVDLDALMRSKAAMYAILTTLLSQVGVAFAQLEKIYVAGAFGRHIDPRQAIILGMLPDLPLSTYVPIGNSSLAGAVKVLLAAECRQRCRRIMQTITYVELNVNQEFMLRFSGAKFIPHTDRALFPSVPLFDGCLKS